MRICLTLFLLALSISLATGCRLDRGQSLATHPGGIWKDRLTRIWHGDSSIQPAQPVSNAVVEPTLRDQATDVVVTSVHPADRTQGQEVIQRPVFEPLGDNEREALLVLEDASGETAGEAAGETAGKATGESAGSDFAPVASVLIGEPDGNENDFSTAAESLDSFSPAPTASEIAGLNAIPFNRLHIDYEKLRRRGWVLNQFVLGLPGETPTDVALATGELELVDAELVEEESESLDDEASQRVTSGFAAASPSKSISESSSTEAVPSEPTAGETPEPRSLSAQLAVRADQEVTPAGQQETVVLHAETDQQSDDPQQDDPTGRHGKSVLASLPSDGKSSSEGKSRSAAEAGGTQPVRDQTQPVRLTAQQVNYRDDKQPRLAPAANRSAPLATAALKPSPANDEQPTAIDSAGNYYLPPQPILRLKAKTPLGKPPALDSEARFLFRDTRIVRGQHLLDGPRRAVPTDREPTRMVNQPRTVLQASQPTSTPAKADGDVRR